MKEVSERSYNDRRRSEKKKTKPSRTRNVKSINIIVVIALIVLIYLVVNIVIAMKKEHLSIYEVQAVSMARNNNALAVIIRDEENYYAGSEGYTSFYVRNGQRVGAGDTVFSLNGTKNLYEYLADYDVKYTMTSDDIKVLKGYISDFNSSYSDSEFDNVFELKESIDAEVQNFTDSYLMEKLDTVMEEKGDVIGLSVVKAPRSGIISFFSDSLDGLRADEVTAVTFDREQYKSKNLYDNELKKADSPVYKLVNDEGWSIIIRLNDEQYENLRESASVSFTIKEDNLHLTQKCTIYSQESAHYCRIDMTDYMVRYIKDRFLNIEFDFGSGNGLKIPSSAVTSKDFFVIPENYYVSYEQGNDIIYGFTYMEYDQETKQTSYHFVEADCYYRDKDQGVVYVDTADFTYGQYIYCMEDETLYQVSVIKQLEGVFNVNKGYAVFRRVEIISDDGEYCIVESNADKSISEYDHIVLNAALIDENLQVY